MIKQLFQVIRKQLSSEDANSGIVNTQSNSAKPSIFQRMQSLKKSPQSKAAKLEQAKQDYLNQAQPSLLQELEPRFMFDGAAIETVDLADGVSQDEQAYVLSAINDNENAYAADSLLAAIEADSEGFAPDYSRYKEVVIVDIAVKDPHILIEQISRDAAVEVILAHHDGVDKIAEILAKYKNLDAIHIISHGDQAQLQLGDVNLNASNLADYKAQLQQWGQALTDTGDILFYGCNVAEGDKGAAFVDELRAMTEADIAASTDITGSELVGGDTVFEESTDVERATVVTFDNYQHILSIDQLGASLIGDDAQDNYGYATALSQDGLIAVVGIPGDNSNRGAIRVLEYSEQSNAWETKASALGDSVGDRMGSSVAISDDGSRIIVGEPQRGSNVGRVRVFDYDGSSLSQLGAEINNNTSAIGSVGRISPDCPQNRAYGSVHGSSC